MELICELSSTTATVAAGAVEGEGSGRGGGPARPAAGPGMDGDRGNRVRPGTSCARERAVVRAVMARLAVPADLDDANHRREATPGSGALAGTGRSRPRWLPHITLRPGHQGPHLHADRSHGGGAHHLAAGDAGRGAQLGLPLHLDARQHLHPPGPALARPGLGGRRVHAVRGRPRAQPGRRPADHVRDRRTPRPDRVDPRRPLRLRRRPPRRVGNGAFDSARTTSTARC